MLDLTLLRVMKYRKEFNALFGAIPLDTLDGTTSTLLQDFKRYFDLFESHDVIDLGLFTSRFETWHSTWTPEKLAANLAVIRLLSDDVDEETKGSLAGDLFEFHLATELNDVVKSYEEGILDAPLVERVSMYLDEFKMKMGAKAANWNDTPIEDLLREDQNNAGLKWRLDCLNRSTRPLRPGDFGIIAARPDKGKTTFLASEITYMASQLPPDRNIIWLNNESVSSRIRKRIFQAALGKPIAELIKLAEAGLLKDEYKRLVGRMDSIRVFDIHGYSVGQVETIIEQNSPGIIVYDMIDNIRGFGSEARTDLALEKMYQWARERSVKYSCIGFATSQVSHEGDGEMFPTLSMLKDSKTGKQGACDFMITIGASNDPNLRNARFISMPKNKLQREDAPGDPHTEVLFAPTQARYLDI